MENINVDVVNTTTGEVLLSNVAQSVAYARTDLRFEDGWRIRPHGVKLVDDVRADTDGEASALGVERINASTAAIRKFDPTFTPTTTARAFGRGVIDGRQVAVRDEFNKLDTPLQAIERFTDAVDSERRFEETVRLREFNVGDDGRWYIGDNAGDSVEMTEAGWSGLCAQLPDDHRRWVRGLMHAPPERLAAEWRWLQANGIKADHEVRVGFRDTEDGDDIEWHRTVSTSYSGDDMTGPALARALGELYQGRSDEGEWRAIVDYDRITSRVKFDVMKAAPIMHGMSAGDPYQYGVRLDTGDGGGTAMSVAGMLLRNLCVNIMIVKLETFAKLTAQHRRGQEAKALANMLRSVAMVDEVMAAVAPLYEKAAKRNIVDVFPGVDVDAAVAAVRAGKPAQDTAMVSVMDAIAGMRAMKRVTSALARDTVTEALLLGWSKEPDSTLLSIERGVTRVHDRIVLAKHVPLFEEAAMPLMAELVR